jgi:hypothetical protein
MFNSGIGGYHSDVLNASVPEDEEGRARLVEELKSRAKGSVKSKNYPEAIQLYSKGIEILPDNAILFANRSMCHLGMGSTKEALEDADKALGLDPAYIKAYYRKAMALIAFNDSYAAKEAITMGLKLAPDDKELLQQLKRVDEDIVKGAQPQASKPKASTSTSTTTSKVPSIPKKKEMTMSEDIAVAVEEEDGIIRGYKKTADGKTTSYFNNELDEQTKALIGSIAPKKIESESSPLVESAVITGSAWNTAGTVETVTHSPWACRRLEELLEYLHVDGPSGAQLCVKKVKSVGGDAEILFVRGKRKNVYDMTVDLEWELTSACGEAMASGTMNIIDISADLDMEVAVHVDRTKTVTSDASTAVKSHVQSAKVGLQPAIVGAINAFVEEFKTK